MATTIKNVFENPATGMFELDGKEFTREEINAIMTLHPDIQWTIVCWQEPPAPIEEN